MPEFKPAGAEFQRFCVSARFPVFSVSLQRTSDMSHLYADLVVPSGVEMDGYQ